LEKLLEINDNESSQEIINILEENSVSKYDETEDSLSVHRRTQQMVKKIASNKEKELTTEMRVEKKVMQILVDEFKIVEKFSSENLLKGKSLISHALKIYDENKYLKQDIN
jgi:hypothetical protein